MDEMAGRIQTGGDKTRAPRFAHCATRVFTRLAALAALASVPGCAWAPVQAVPQKVMDSCNGFDHSSPAESAKRVEQACSAALATRNGLDSANTAGALVNRGTARLAMGKVDAAISDFSAALQINPNLAPAYADRALAYASSGNAAAADADIDRMFQLRPNNSESYVARCSVRFVGGNQLGSAYDDCRTALNLAPGNPQALGAMANVEFKRGDYAEALKDINAAYKSGTEDPAVLYLRGLCRRKTGDQAGGDHDIAAAKALEPGIEAGLGKEGLGP